MGGTKGWYLSENSTRLAEGEVSQLEKLGTEETHALSAQIQSRPWLAWKHIPTPDGVGTDVSYPTLLSSKLSVTDAWSGRGKVRFFETAFDQTPQNHRVSAALAKLPIPEEGEAIMIEGSLDLPQEVEGDVYGVAGGHFALYAGEVNARRAGMPAALAVRDGCHPGDLDPEGEVPRTGSGRGGAFVAAP